ncbi:unnamed protein product [Medioppia subpectinata]|uniref:SCP domain-containing protein n=1 Tax=Medioppia subpectinata TaxID=1979941 RepID=A0A7R9KUE9_9ACAR|nr:unnamed protein product [Medioppia subpectinata]CAG2109662.1 unnamed protein product [Medioppia subpectinata]
MDPDLVKYAEWRCPNADAGHLQDDDAHGENIAQGWAPSPGIIVDVDFRSCSAVMDYWASEEVNYDYAGHGANNRGETMHFTALVWVNSTIIGCAKCPSHAYQISVVCNFQAPGNIEEPSYEAANVFPPLDSNIP